ncbi:Receptor L-domain domain-containing protein [Caenorhabditis elegans]|uniref:Receptor L-domain domain-containing protein n=1 Tax=Caenorhabditis elegans TaxID=6239 RepID=O44602_CAEEL|nr:Receptor L-domain domain-containing protein [Caenorhabditis elegans]CCD69535.2 Receptor L-domain domain-containing protein [Caenorhabditis elegans]|eukprot:NP_503643.2 Insulin/EGF-Receptor L Domain protein [Caenorhabditis elegans]
MLKTIFTFHLLIAISNCDTTGPFDTEEDAEIFLNERCGPPCIFSYYPLNLETFTWFPKNCTTVCADIAINSRCDLSEDQLVATFQNMKHLIGSLLVQQTDFTSGKFLAGLETIECGGENRVRRNTDYISVSQFRWIYNDEMLELGLTNLTTIGCRNFEISSGSLTNLNVPNLKNISYSLPTEGKISVTLRIQNDDFCLTSGELLSIIETSVLEFQEPKGKYCEPASAVENGKVCNSTSLTDGCTQIFGSLVIGPDNKQFVSHLKKVEVIFGGLVVNNTNLTNIDFLESLKYIYHLDKKAPAIQIENNPNLSNFSFPSLVVAQTLQQVVANTKIIFSNNNNILSSDSSYCFRLKNMLNLTERERIYFDGKQCENLPTKSTKSLAFESFIFAILIIKLL